MNRFVVVLVGILLAIPVVHANTSDPCDVYSGLEKVLCKVRGLISSDFDLVPDSVDNCPNTFNPSQRDSDENGIGDACDDSDGDTYFADDNCPDTYNPSQRDSDGDGIGDACDYNAGDLDWDGVPNLQDNCVRHYNPSQSDSDGNGWGDVCDVCSANAFTRIMYFVYGSCPGIA